MAIATAKLNDIDPQAWLADALSRLPDHPANRIYELLPGIATGRASQLTPPRQRPQTPLTMGLPCGTHRRRTLILCSIRKQGHGRWLPCPIHEYQPSRPRRSEFVAQAAEKGLDDEVVAVAARAEAYILHPSPAARRDNRAGR